MTKAISVLFGLALLVAAPAAYAAETITKITVKPSLVAPSDDVEITIDVDLSNGDDWDAVAYRFESGDFFCVDTPDHVDNVLGTKSVSETISVTAPNADGTYDVDIRIYDEDDCDDFNGVISSFDNDHVASASENDGLTVQTPDQCPNVTGHQAAGPCADTLCVLPDVWSIANQQCEAPAPQNAPNPGPSTGSSMTGGGGYMKCSFWDGWAVGSEHRCLSESGEYVRTMDWRGGNVGSSNAALIALYTQVIQKLNQILGLL